MKEPLIFGSLGSSSVVGIGRRRGYDLVVDCTDTPPSRYLLNDGALCAQRPLVAASAVGLHG